MSKTLLRPNNRFRGVKVTSPLRYQVLDFIRDPKKGTEIADANQKHIVSVLSQDELLSELRSFLDQIDTIEDSDFEGLFLHRLMNLGWIRSLLDKLVSPVFDIFDLVPQLKAHEDSYFNVLEIFWHSKMNVFLSIVDAERAELFSAPDPNFNVMSFTTYLCFLQGGPATIRLFNVDGGRFEAKDFEVKSGDVVPVRGTKNSMKFLSCKSDFAVLAINSLTATSHDVLRCSSADGQVIKRSSNDVKAQRFFLYSTVLRKMERNDAIEALGRLLDHEEPTLRWHAMREMLAIDAPAAAPYLVRLASSDRDEIVRTTANATIEKHRAILFP